MNKKEIMESVNAATAEMSQVIARVGLGQINKETPIMIEDLHNQIKALVKELDEIPEEFSATRKRSTGMSAKSRKMYDNLLEEELLHVEFVANKSNEMKSRANRRLKVLKSAKSDSDLRKIRQLLEMNAI